MLEVKVKYFKGATKLEKIDKGDWIDVYAREEVILDKNDYALVPLGFAMQLPKGYEAHLAPRSSAFEKWGITQTNGVGVIDESYCGDGDEWKMPVYCLETRHTMDTKIGTVQRTIIRKGDKIGQFRLMKKMEEVKFTEVASLGNEDRGGFGSTGNTK